MNIVSKAELARIFGVNQSRIYAYLGKAETPRLVETEDGRIDLDNPINMECVEFRKKSVPKFTGNLNLDDEEECYLDVEQIELFKSGGELDLSSIKNKKDAELQLAMYKLSKSQKENQLLDLTLKKELKKVVETDVMERVLMRSYDFLLSNLRTKPLQIINKLRDIILTDSYKNNEDVKYLVDVNIEIYKDALEETRKAMLEIYGNESTTDTG